MAWTTSHHLLHRLPRFRSLLLLALFLPVQPGRAFNLDTRFPVVKKGETPGSLFGLSVALHEQTVGEKRHLLLVGAPKEKAEVNVAANQTGGVYTCPINMIQSDCIRIGLIGSDTDIFEVEDRVEDMWLGVTVASQGQPGGRVLACGHRFVKLYGVQRLRQMIGRCYVRGNDLSYQDNDGWNPEQVCSHIGDVEAEVMCNMGISASISDTQIIVGSPGSFEWQGNVHVSWMNPTDIYATKRSSFPNLKTRHIYIGYSVAEAPRLLSQDEVTVVTGAPKDSKEDARGSVILAVKTLSRSGEQLTPRHTLRGEQTGSYYGNSLAVTDLDSNGWNDLLVGAPFYFDRQRERGGAVYLYLNRGGAVGPEPSLTLTGPPGSGFGMALAALGDIDQDGFQDFAVGAPFHGTGSVMIWTGSSKGISQKPSQVIEGKDVSGGAFRTFGYSLSGGVDVDRNRYPDLLVGSLDDHVALLRARPVIHLNKTLSVTPGIVDPDSCDYCVQVEVCFSYTLSTGDKDFKKNITVQFTVEADVTRHISRVRFQDNDQDVYTGFLSMPSTSCHTLTLGLVRKIRDKVEPLVFSLNASLVQAQPHGRQALQNLDGFPVLSQNQPAQLRTEVHFQKACGSDNRCQSNLQMNAEYCDENNVAFPRHGQGAHQVFQYNSSVKRIQLVVNVTNLPLPGRLAEDAHNTILNVTLLPALHFVRSTNQKVMKPLRPQNQNQNQNQKVMKPLRPQNQNQNQNQKVMKPLRPQNQNQKSGGAVVVCSSENQVVLCELGNPFSSNHRVEVRIYFETSEISLDTREIQSQLTLSTLSEQSDLQPLSLSMVVEYSLVTSFSLVQQTSHAQFGGQVIGESAMKTTSDIGTPVHFTFKVDVIGKPLGNLGNFEVEFDWPWEVSNGKWLLYLADIQSEGTSETRCVPPGDIVNPLKLKLSKEEEEKQRQKRRSLGEEPVVGEELVNPQAALNLKGRRKKTYTLDCIHGAARCVKFICPLRHMNNSATLTVRARLWNSTMLEDFTEAWRVSVRGQAALKLVSDKATVRMDTQTREFGVEVEPEHAEETEHSAPLWIIIVSAVAGTLLLALISVLLWKCGFFRRASTRELYEAKAQKAHVKTQPSEGERLTEEH
ncbi:integrin alpha-3-like [Aplochiton taeniatus]